MNIRILHFVFVALLIGQIVVPQSTFANSSSIELETVEKTVRTYFKEIPVMIEIARCESKFRQFNTDGSVLRGGHAGNMIGVFQFYESIHNSAAAQLGFKLETLEGNLGYAKHLYATSGTTPWNSARTCWETTVVAKTNSQLSDTDISKLLARIEVLKKTLAKLQLLLEKKKVTMVR